MWFYKKITNKLLKFLNDDIKENLFKFIWRYDKVNSNNCKEVY